MTKLLLAHLYATSSTPTGLQVGSPKQALIFALTFTLVILITYLFIDHLPKPKKNLINPRTEPNYIKAMLIIIALAVFTGTWDVWWHRAVGRDSFFVPPHIVLYSLVTIVIGLSFYVWRHSRDIVWKHTTFSLLFIPIAAAFDNFFHTLWGPEDLSSPVKLPWSPGHLLLILSVMVAVVLQLYALFKYRKTNDFNFYGNLGFGILFALISFALIPFHPTEGFGQIAGFAGAGVLSTAFVAVILTAQHHLRGRMDAILTTMIGVLMMLTAFGKETAPQIIMLPHDRPPIWLVIFTFLAFGLLMDITRNRFQTWTRGMMAGIVWSAMLFGFSNIFFATQFQYGLTEIFIAIVFSAVGGLVAGSVYGLTHLRDEEHLRKMLAKF
jgi:hypothetical protein